MVSNEKREELVEALTMDYVGMALYHKNRAIAERIVDRVIQAGWQWHPPVLEDFDLDHNKVALKPHQEVDILDRIVHDLPMRPVFISNDELIAHSDLMEPVEMANGVKLYDVNSLYPQEVKELWKQIPEFDNYEIDYISKTVRSRWTKRALEVAEQGGAKYVDLHDKDGHPHDCNVDYLYERTFGN